MKNKITKDMSISEIISKFPETVEVLQKYGFSCIGCPFAMMENLEQGAKSHGVKLKKLLKELNDVVNRGE